MSSKFRASDVPLCPFIIWDYWDDYSIVDNSDSDFMEFVLLNNYQQMVTGPTHQPGNILDLVFANRNSVFDITPS